MEAHYPRQTYIYSSIYAVILIRCLMLFSIGVTFFPAHQHPPFLLHNYFIYSNW